MILLITLGILGLIACINYFITRHLLHPSVVYVGIWCFQLIGLLFLNDRYTRISIDVLFMIVLGAVAFSIGAVLAQINLFRQQHIIRPRSVRRDSTLFLGAVVVVAICLKGQYRIFTELSNNGDWLTSLVYARTLISVENEDIYGLYKYGTAVALGVLLTLEILIVRNEAKLRHKLLFGYFLLTAISMAILSTGRGPIAFVFLLLGAVYVLNGEKEGISRRAAGVLAGLISFTFVVFWIIGRSTGKADDQAAVAAYDLIDYLFSSIPALSVYVDQNAIQIIGGDWGKNTFRFFLALSAAVGIGEKPPTLVQEFVTVPHLTNLYTIYLQYVKDFGWAGVVVLPLLLGYLHAYLFRWAMMNRENEYALYVLSVSYLPLLQTIFQETHFSLASNWIQFALIGFIFTISQKRKINVFSHPNL